MVYNPNSGYGEQFKTQFEPLSGGKVFMVAPSTHPSYSMFQELFPPDPEGAIRLFTTLASALAACSSGRNDTIYIAEGYAETVTSTSLTLNVAGVSIIGMGRGLNRPTFTFSTAAAVIGVSAANITFQNMVCIANFADVAAAFLLTTAKDFTVDNCLFIETGTDLNWFNIVVTSASNNVNDGLTLTNNVVHQQDAAAKAFISVLGNLDRAYWSGNTVVNNSTVDAAQFATLSSKVLLAARITNNFLHVVGVSHANNVGILLTGTSTTSSGFVANNYVGSINSATALLVTTGMGFIYINNLITKIADKSGLVLPAIT